MVPKYDEMVRATLASLRKRGGVATNREIEDDIVAKMNLSEETAAELHGNGPQTEVGYRAAWTRTWLRRIGAMHLESFGGDWRTGKQWKRPGKIWRKPGWRNSTITDSSWMKSSRNT